ncbi:MAG TPA: hypothetical protein VGZ47_09340 [Gemmataceae bacterium]|nr:hypothetical protein [Gemmataceae bacterium]
MRTVSQELRGGFHVVHGTFETADDYTFKPCEAFCEARSPTRIKESYMFKAIGLAALTVAALSSTAYAGCLGAGLGDGCIGIPTPREHREVYEGHRYRHDPVIVEHHNRRPVIIEGHHDDDED